MFPKPSKPFVAGCICGLLGGIVFTVCAELLALVVFRAPLERIAAGNMPPPPIPITDKASYDWTVISLEGEAFDMEQTRGKVTFLQFWRPGCPVCLMEIPVINRLYAAVAAEDIAFVSIMLDKGAEDPKQIVEANGINYPVYTIEGRPPPIYEFQSTPTAFIIAPNGDVVLKHSLGAKWDDDTVVAFIRQLRAGAGTEKPED